MNNGSHTIAISFGDNWKNISQLSFHNCYSNGKHNFIDPKNNCVEICMYVSKNCSLRTIGYSRSDHNNYIS